MITLTLTVFRQLQKDMHQICLFQDVRSGRARIEIGHNFDKAWVPILGRLLAGGIGSPRAALAGRPILLSTYLDYPPPLGAVL